jgi:hypothetical protein
MTVEWVLDEPPPRTAIAERWYEWVSADPSLSDHQRDLFAALADAMDEHGRVGPYCVPRAVRMA